jgi:hypothetical protein
MCTVHAKLAQFLLAALKHPLTTPAAKKSCSGCLSIYSKRAYFLKIAHFSKITYFLKIASFNKIFLEKLAAFKN